MLRVAGIFALLMCGAAAAADLEIVPRRDQRSAPVMPAPLMPAAPQPPLPLQTTIPPDAPAPDGKEVPAFNDQKPVDTLSLPPAGAPSQGESWWQQIVRNAPHCKAFSDGCRRCDVGFHCSSLPIACQPKEFTCVDPQP
jgi:hypothetical protein